MTPDQMTELAARLHAMTTATKLDEYDIKTAADLIDSMAQRVPLPDHEIVTMYDECPRSDADMIEFARAIEAAHGIRSDK